MDLNMDLLRGTLKPVQKVLEDADLTKKESQILEPKVCQSTNTIFCLTNTICAGGGEDC